LFYFVAKHGGIAAAVRNIPYGIQQPAVSGQIAKLEDRSAPSFFSDAHSRFRLQAWNCSSSLSRSSTTSRSSVRSSVKQVAQLRIAAPSNRVARLYPRVAGEASDEIPEFRLICMSGALRSGKDYSWLGTSILRLPLSRKNRALGLRFGRYLSSPLILLVHRKSKLGRAEDLWKRDKLKKRSSVFTN